MLILNIWFINISFYLAIFSAGREITLISLASAASKCELQFKSAPAGVEVPKGSWIRAAEQYM